MGLISDQGSPYDARRPASGGEGRHSGPGYGQADGYGRGQRAGYGGRASDGYGRGEQAGYHGGGQRAGYDHDSARSAGRGRDGDGGYAAGRGYDGDGGYAFRGTEGYRPGRDGGVRRRRVAGRRRRYRRLGGLPVPGMAVVALVASIAVVAAAVGASRLLTAHTAAASAPAINVNCTLIVPANPLTAQGLATPYQLTATNPADGPCNEANANQTAFVQGAIIDPATGQISVYDPLVIDAGTQPAAAPVVPALPAGAVVAVWFGFNGNTLSLAGPDQVTVTPSPATATPTQPVASPTSTPTATLAGTPASTPATQAASPSAPAGGTPTVPPTSSGTPTEPPTSSETPAGSESPANSASPADSASPSGSAAAAVEAEGSAPLSPGSSAHARYSGTLTPVGQAAGGKPARGGHNHPSPPAEGSGQASPTASMSATVGPAGSASAAPTTGPTTTGPTTAGPTAAPATSAPPAGDAPAASASPDAILQQANCVAGEYIGGQFSSFTQVGACNAIAFFSAVNAAIAARKLHVPSPGVAADGMRCLTTRSFALIDQDQSDNVTTEYLANANGQTAQDTAANRQGLAGSSVLFNGSDNGLLDLFVDPALGCSPWQVPNLTDGGAPGPALPLDEIQAARWAGAGGSPAALVPLNDPMTLDGNGNYSADKTNTYRSLVDMRSLPAGQSPRAYCADMERIQASRIQQDVNLLTQNPGPAPGAANSLFTFLAMRLQQSFTNLNCGSFGLQNVVTTTVDGNGIVVAACFLSQVAAVTPGTGNPMAGTTVCPATTTPAATTPAATTPASGGATSSAAQASPTPSGTATASSWRRHHGWHHHWWW